MEMVRKYADKPFAVLGVSSDAQGRSGLAKIVQDFKLNYRSAVDGPNFSGISTDYKIRTHPTTFVIDAKGKVRYMWEGFVAPEVMTRAVEELLKEATAK